MGSCPAISADNSLVMPHSPVLGPDAAPAMIVEFFDPSCETCSAFYLIVKQIMEASGGSCCAIIRCTKAPARPSVF
ncbi:thioredoxin domain-containing protein [Rhizobium sp. PL01]|uniref:thioredoxin domain-containing protein n=1 Tax=Rhizobium sp. PL01 TaxID=3085631 RepID=UPI00399528AF